jgi:hypothetical protein
MTLTDYISASKLHNSFTIGGEWEQRFASRVEQDAIGFVESVIDSGYSDVLV